MVVRSAGAAVSSQDFFAADIERLRSTASCDQFSTASSGDAKEAAVHQLKDIPDSPIYEEPKHPGTPSKLYGICQASEHEEAQYQLHKPVRGPPGFEDLPNFATRPSGSRLKDETAESVARVSDWMTYDTDEVPDLEDPEEELDGYNSELEEDDTGIGKSSTRGSSMMSSSSGTMNYHTFGAAQVQFPHNSHSQ